MYAVNLFKAAIILSVVIFFIPKAWKLPFAIVLQFTISVVTTLWAVEALQSSQELFVPLGIPFWNGDAILTIDKLAAFFIVIVNFTSLTGAFYGLGYLRVYIQEKSDVSISLHTVSFFLLHVAMLHVVMLREGFSFLMAWELMSVFSFVLVIFEGHRESILKTSINYLLQMHVGFLCLVLGLLLINNYTGELNFGGLSTFFHQYNNLWLFLLFFVGFGIKAGFMPFHSWLPHAHPAAPSHVSGVMSGVMIKMGIYGILRVLTYVESEFLELGVLILSISIVTAIGGILNAVFQKDMKKTLAYSSIENIGIIGMGLGVALIGKSIGNDIFVTLGLVSSLFHVLNHSLYKSLLFYTAGNVYYATHTRDLNKLGGLAQHMPYSTAIFMVGALAICAIPPLNGFVSEFILYTSAFKSIASAQFTTSLLSLCILLSLVLVGGISIYAFTKTFGIAFLGSQRQNHKHPITEVPLLMRMPQALIILTMLIISIAPAFFIKQIAGITSMYPSLNVPLTTIQNTLDVVTYVGYGNLMVIILSGLIMVLKRVQQSQQITGVSPTWGCGYSAGDFRHQYTSTSYAKNLLELTSHLVAVKSEKPIFSEAEIFPTGRKFETQSKDLLEENVVLKPVNFVLKNIQKGSVGQTGMINHYLVYPLAFLLLIGLLTLFGWI